MERWFAATKGIKANAVVVEIDFSTDQPMRPLLGDEKAVTED